jgi:hypothetical protein
MGELLRASKPATGSGACQEYKSARRDGYMGGVGDTSIVAGFTAVPELVCAETAAVEGHFPLPGFWRTGRYRWGGHDMTGLGVHGVLSRTFTIQLPTPPPPPWGFWGKLSVFNALEAGFYRKYLVLRSMESSSFKRITYAGSSSAWSRLRRRGPMQRAQPS